MAPVRAGSRSVLPGAVEMLILATHERGTHAMYRHEVVESWTGTHLLDSMVLTLDLI